MYDYPEHDKPGVLKNAVSCGICGAPADLINRSFYQCQNVPGHLGNTVVGIFDDLTTPQSEEAAMTYFYDGRSFGTAAEALEASIYDYVTYDQAVRPEWVDLSEGWHEPCIKAARKDSTAYYMEDCDVENWLVFDGDEDGKPHHFTDDQIHAAFDAVAERLRKDLRA